MKAVQYSDWGSFETAMHAAGYTEILCGSDPVGAQHRSSASRSSGS